jgi:uncharacterized protein
MGLEATPGRTEPARPHEEGDVSADDRWFPGHLHTLEASECWELLSCHEVGRVAYVDGLGPMVVPITFVVLDDAVLFRVAADSTLARHLPGEQAALEVDDIDDFTRSAWNVVLRGPVAAVTGHDLAHVDSWPTPWPEGARTLHLRLTPDLVAGRRLLEA